MKKYWFIIMSFLALPLLLPADESPSVIADAVTLAARVAALEARVAALESPKATAAKPVLEIHTEDWCAPCKLLKADLSTVGELPVEIRYSKFSGTIPAFRWTDSSGKTTTRTGYTRGAIQGIFKEIVDNAP